MVETTRIIHHNQLLFTKFGKKLRHIEAMTSKVQPAAKPRSQGHSSLPPLVVGTKILVAADHVTIYPFKTTGWVGTQVHLVERTIKYPTLPADFSITQILVSPKMGASRFISLTEESIADVLNDKDSENTII